jgi:hypothetical protein
VPREPRIACLPSKEDLRGQRNAPLQPNSSANARAALTSFGELQFGGNRFAKFYVHGRRGDACQIARGNGELSESACNFKMNFLCEYFELKHLLCDSSDPIQCIYQSPITRDNMIMVVESPATYENVTNLFLEFVPETLFLPVDLAATFKNLKDIQARGCSVATLNRRTFAGLTKLRYLDLEGNQLKELRSSTFEGLTSLKTLYLSKSEVFVYETSIHFTISTDENPLTTISADLFTVAIPNLELLSLDYSSCISTLTVYSNAAVKTLLETVTHTCILV